MRSQAEASGMPTHAFLFFVCMSIGAAEDDGFSAAVEHEDQRPAGASLGLFAQPAVV